MTKPRYLILKRTRAIWGTSIGLPKPFMERVGIDCYSVKLSSPLVWKKLAQEIYIIFLVRTFVDIEKPFQLSSHLLRSMIYCLARDTSECEVGQFKKPDFSLFRNRKSTLFSSLTLFFPFTLQPTIRPQGRLFFSFQRCF